MSQLVYVSLQSREGTFKRGDAPILAITRHGDRGGGEQISGRVI
jgi:hypothetical protein